MDNIYKSNLECLCNIKNNEYLIIKNNKLIVDDRYFINWRYNNNINNVKKIIEIYETSFNHFINIIESPQSSNSSLIVKNSEKLTQLNIYEYNSSIVLLLEQSLNGFSRLENTYKLSSEKNNKNIIIEINNTYNKLKNNIDNIKIIIEKYKKQIKLVENNIKINYNKMIWTNFFLFSAITDMELLLTRNTEL
jgi:hypothetical protein